MAARELFNLVGGYGEQVGDAGCDFREEGGLGGMQGWLWEKVEVLQTMIIRDCVPWLMLGNMGLRQRGRGQ